MIEYFKRVDAGIRYMLLASLLFAFMGAFAKLASEVMSSLEVVFFRNLFGVIIIGYTIYKSGKKSVGGKPFLLFFRGLMGFLALLTYFYNIAHISLGDAVTYSKTAPIFTALFAYIFLKERLSSLGWIAILVGFGGIVLVAQPSSVGFSKYDLLGIFSGVGAALAYTSIRELRKYYETSMIVLSFTLVGTLGPILLFLISHFYYIDELDFLLGEFVVPSGITWVYIVGLGVLGTLSQYYMTKSYATTKAGVASAVSYTNIAFAIGVGVMLGDELPSLITTLGVGLIIVAGVLVTKEK